MQSPLAPGNGTSPPRFRIDDLEVDIGKAEVRRGDENIALPKLSFDLLCALINAAPAIVTNDELLERVWPGLQVSPESVAQRVKLLRSALGDDSQQPRYILGVRGRGYRLIPAVERCDVNLPRSDASNQPVNTASATIPSEPPSRSATASSSNGHSKRVIIGAAALVAIGVAAWLGWHSWSSSHTAAQPSTVAMQDESIAVLPFTDMSEKKDQEYFADGMAEEIIDLLVKVPGLKVISRTSSFQFKGKTEDLRNIGTQLGVAYVLEGSVRKSGDRVRITAQLIDSRDGAHLMSQSYDRDFSDVLKMQDEIAASLVRVLQVEVSEHVLVARASLSNTQAYMLYLQGLHAKDRFDRQGFEQAVNDFQQALDLDPSFAAAAGGLANAYFLLGQFGFLEPSIAFDKAREAAQRALELDPKLAATHALSGNIDIAYEWGRAAASEQIQLALADARKEAYVLFIAAVQAQVMGRQDEALKLIGASLAQDPLNPSSYLILSYIQIRRERPVEAEAALRRTLQISPTFIFAHYYLGLVLLARGDAHGAIEEVSRENDEGLRLAGSAIVDFAVGAKADSDAALKQMLKTHAQRAYEIAGVYAFRGETDEAFQWLDRAYSQKDPYLVSIKGNPMLKKIESDPRYKAFLKKMNLPEG